MVEQKKDNLLEGIEEDGSVPPAILQLVLSKKDPRNDIIVKENENGEIPGHSYIGLFFCEPHDHTSRIWGSIVNSLQ